MAKKSQTTTFGQLPAAVSIANEDIFALQAADGLNYKVTGEQIKDFIIHPDFLLSSLIIDVSKDWETFQIKNVGDPTDPQDVVTKAYGDANYVDVAIVSINGDTTTAQIIAGGTGIDIVDTGATHTINIGVHDHEDAAGGGNLVATLSLTATGTKDATTFLRGDNTWDVPLTVGQTPITQDIDFDNFKILDINTITFHGLGGTAGANNEIWIGSTASNNWFQNIPVNGTHQFQVNGAATFSTSQAENRFFYPLNTKGNAIRFDGFDVASATQHITPSASGLLFALPTGDDYDFKINNISKLTIDANTVGTVGSDLFLQGGDIHFANSSTSIIDGASGLVYDVITGRGHIFRINDGEEYTFDATTLNMNGNTLTGGGGITNSGTINQSGHITLQTGNQIYWVDSTRRIENDGDGFNLHIPTGDSYNLFINSVQEYDFDATQADFKGNNIINVGSLTATTITNTTYISSTVNPAQSEEIRLAKTDRIAWRNHANNADLEISLESDSPTNVLRFNGMGINPSFMRSGGTLPTTGFIRMGFDTDLVWRNQSDDDNNQLRVSNGERLQFGPVGTLKNVILTDSVDILTNKTSLGVGYITSNTATPATDQFLRLAKTDRISWRNQGDTDNYDFFLSSSDFFELQAGLKPDFLRFGGIAPSAGVIKLGFDADIAWRNQSDTTDYELNISSGAGDRLRYGPTGSPKNIVTEDSSDTLTNKTFSAFSMTDATDITVGTTTGTKIGTATSQKIGFWDVTPIVQPAHIADATDAASVITQLNALLAQMAALGLQAAA